MQHDSDVLRWHPVHGRRHRVDARMVGNASTGWAGKTFETSICCRFVVVLASMSIRLRSSRPSRADRSVCAHLAGAYCEWALHRLVNNMNPPNIVKTPKRQIALFPLWRRHAESTVKAIIVCNHYTAPVISAVSQLSVRFLASIIRLFFGRLSFLVRSLKLTVCCSAVCGWELCVNCVIIPLKTFTLLRLMSTISCFSISSHFSWRTLACLFDGKQFNEMTIVKLFVKLSLHCYCCYRVCRT